MGIVALALYLIPHINYVRMGQRDVRQMPYSAYRWVARMFESVPKMQCCAFRRCKWSGEMPSASCRCLKAPLLLLQLQAQLPTTCRISTGSMLHTVL